MTHLKEEIERVPLLGEFRSQNQDCPEQRIMVEGNANGGGGGAGHSVEIPETAHQISTDSWFQACFVLTSGINSAYVLGYSGTVIIHLGWITGVVGMLVVTALSLYASTLPVKLHELGGRRHIRFRDLAGYIYGKKGYYTVWTLQYINLFMINIGFIILAGSALKDVYSLFDDDNGLKLSYCNLIAGFACFTFAIFIPHLSALRVWLGFSTVLSSIYITIAIVLSVKDGITEPERDYSIPGMFSTRVFTTIGSLANLFVTLNTGMLPEIQATVREPNVSNMMKALYFQFTVGLIPMYVVVFVGYWAYGASTSSYLLDNTTGPTWVKALANIAAFLQAVISFHIFASPSYEYFDTKYNITGSPLAIRSLSFRIGLRGTYLFISSMAAALIPFLGDCLSLTGALCTLPLTFVIPNHMYLVVKKNKLNSMQKLWHLLNVCVFGCWSIAATVAAVRLTIVDTKTY